MRRIAIMITMLAGCGGGESTYELVKCGGEMPSQTEIDRWSYASQIVSTRAELDTPIDFRAAEKCEEPCALIVDGGWEDLGTCTVDETRISPEMMEWYPDGECNRIEWEGQFGCCIAGVRQISVNGTPAPGVAFLECE